jgi:hypothetical protein
MKVGADEVFLPQSAATMSWRYAQNADRDSNIVGWAIAWWL